MVMVVCFAETLPPGDTRGKKHFFQLRFHHTPPAVTLLASKACEESVCVCVHAKNTSASAVPVRVAGWQETDGSSKYEGNVREKLCSVCLFFLEQKQL